MPYSLLGLSKKTQLPPGTDKELSETFLNFFNEKIDNIRDTLDLQTTLPVDLRQSQGSILSDFHEISQDDIIKCIHDSSTKTCDLDPIPTSLLKECMSDLAPYITNVINASLTSGAVPDLYKQAVVKPLLKKSGLDEHQLKNFRPVSNLNFLSKILERVVLNQILQHIESNNLGELYQSAYKQNHSTETALLKVTSDILDEIDDKKVCFLVLLDLSAAFDTIDHEILIKRLQTSFLLSGTVLDWFKSYLDERYMSVKVGNEMSKKTLLKYGVPQGSVLGPVLFTMYVQPLSKLIHDFGLQCHLYADDTQLYCSCAIDDIENVINTISQCINAISLWMNTNKLKLNEDKTEAILFGTSKSIKEISCEYLMVCDNKILLSDTVKNLGVTLDRELSMTQHITSLCKSLNFQLRKIGNIRKYLTNDITKTLVTSLILSKLDYCNALLGGLPQESIHKLQNVQNNAARLITLSRKRDHITPILRDLHWLSVRDRIVFKICLLCHKCLNNSAPIYLSNGLTRYIPARPLRSASDQTILVKPERNYKAYGQRSFQFLAPRIWNELPRNIREEASVNSFKSQLKTHLFSSSY